MTTLLELLRLDLLGWRDYFRRDRGTKSLIVGFFGVIGLMVYLGILALCLSFFYMLSSYQTFGHQTVAYVINASLVVLAFVAVGSTIVGSVAHFISPGPIKFHLLSLGVPSWQILTWTQLKQLVFNILLCFVFLSPIQLAYDHIFHGQISFLGQMRLLLVCLGLVSYSQALGSLAALTITPLVARLNSWLVLGLTTLSFVLASALLISLLLPSTLRQLYYSQPHEFNQLYNQLLLNRPNTPNYVWSNMLQSHTSIDGVAWVGLGIASLGLTLFFLSARYLRLLQASSIHPVKSKRNLIALAPNSPLPLVRFWLIQILRDQRELGYLIFFLVLALLFHLLLGRSQFIREFETKWLAQLFFVSLSWMSFITAAYSLRLIFPLASRLKTLGWYLLSAPVSSTKQVLNLLGSATLLSLPLALLALMVWASLPIGTAWQLLGLVTSLTLIPTIVLVNLFVGIVLPVFEQGDQPELVSSSTQGLICLIWSLALSAIVVISVLAFLQGQIRLVTMFSLTWVSQAASVLLLSGWARYRFANYQL